MAGSSNALDVISAIREDVKYMQASSVNVSSFVSGKLSGPSNYDVWKAQMLCLIECHQLVHVLDDKVQFPIDKGVHMIPQYKKLVKGWLFGTMSDQLVINYFPSFMSAQHLWKELESTFKPPADKYDSQGFKFGKELLSNVPEMETTASKRLRNELHNAAVEGCWWKAKSILKINKNAATKAIIGNGNTILHIAVEMGHDRLLEKLLQFLKDGKDVETRNYRGRTALHIAAVVGNAHAAKLLVRKRKELLEILDSNNDSPYRIAYANNKLNICAYLFKSALPSDLRLSSYEDQPSALIVAVLTKQYDLAEELLKNVHELSNKTYETILLGITITFPSDLDFMESVIYPSFHNVHQKALVRGSLIFHSNFLDKCVDDFLQSVKICNNTCYNWLGEFSIILLVPIIALYPAYHLICFLILLLRLPLSVLYFLLWNGLAVAVRPIKNIEKKRKEYQEAKKILSLICTRMGTSYVSYRKPLFEAVRQGTYEVIDEILYTSPTTINYKDEDGYNVIQSSIINRSEKVYNLIYHIIERTKSYRIMKDSSNNTLVHLAGRLAPSFVLGRTAGAALQLQRELIWREEVEKLLLPTQLRVKNMDGETPAMVFTREHQDLMKQGENWMKTTSESCSITAALIVTIVFAAAITVPGGSNQDSGIPVFNKEIAFTIFAVSNAFSLFTGATALLLFLSILTARFSENNFLISLPRRLLFGLLTLFLSTTLMMIAFGAILFLVFCDKRPWMLAPIFGFACLPFSVIVTIKLPLLVDLVKSTYSPSLVSIVTFTLVKLIGRTQSLWNDGVSDYALQ